MPTPARIRQADLERDAEPFPPPHCTTWEDCRHDGICHDPRCCGARGPNHEAFYGEEEE